MEAEYRQVVINKTELLKHVIKEHLFQDVNQVGRDSLLVDCRFMYFHILRDVEGMVFQKIADTVNMNHASVVHGCTKAKFWLKTDHEYRDKYLTILANYNRVVYGLKKAQETEKLRDKLNKEQEEKIENIKNPEHKRPMKRIGEVYDKLHILIDKTPEEKVDDLYTRVEAIYNMMQMDLKRKRI